MRFLTGAASWRCRHHDNNLHGCHGDVSLRQTEFGRFGDDRQLDLELGHLGHGPILEKNKTTSNKIKTLFKNSTFTRY